MTFSILINRLTFWEIANESKYSSLYSLNMGGSFVLFYFVTVHMRKRNFYFFSFKKILKIFYISYSITFFLLYNRSHHTIFMSYNYKGWPSCYTSLLSYRYTVPCHCVSHIMLGTCLILLLVFKIVTIPLIISCLSFLFKCPPNTFCFEKCAKKNYWIFSQISVFIWMYNPSS